MDFRIEDIMLVKINLDLFEMTKVHHEKCKMILKKLRSMDLCLTVFKLVKVIHSLDLL